MSASGDQRILNNLSQILEEAFDRFDNDLTELKSAVDGLSTFYEESFKEYQVGKITRRAQCYYKPSLQKSFKEHSNVISGKMEAVFTVMKDMNAVISLPKNEVNTEANQMQKQGQNNFYLQAKPVSVEKRGTWLQRFFGSASQIPEELLDAHKMTKDLHLQTLNIQNLWKQLIHTHRMGIIREGALADYYDGEKELEDFYVDGQDDYAKAEAMFFSAYVEPEVIKLVERGQKLGREKFLSEIVLKALIRSSEHDERMKLAMPFSPGGQLPQKPETKV